MVRPSSLELFKQSANGYECGTELRVLSLSVLGPRFPPRLMVPALGLVVVVLRGSSFGNVTSRKVGYRDLLP